MLKSAWKKWLKFARIIGNFNGQVILTVFYFTIFAPFAILSVIFSDPLRLRKKSEEKSTFGSWDHPKEDERSARRQF